MSNNKSQVNFLSHTAHQLKTPLGSIRWNLETLIDGIAGDINPEAQDILHDIYESNQHMNNLVNELLIVSRMDQGVLITHPVATNLASVIKDVLRDLSHLTDFKHLNIIFKEPKEDIILNIDPSHFKEIMENLLSNAIKYNHNHGALRIILKQDNVFATIKITDTGIGIPMQDQNKLFSRFFRAHNAADSDIEGTGLGLFIVKQHIKRLGGNIQVQSIEDHGTIITLTIPTTTTLASVS